MTIHVRPVTPGDEAAWRSMWSNYNTFYKSTVEAQVTASTWSRILNPNSSIGAIVAESDTGLVGFANYVVQIYTWSERPRCLMEDLFVGSEFRGQGAGRALIQYLVDLARSNGWTELYWITQESNAVARKLYDTFAPPDGFIQYTVELDP